MLGSDCVRVTVCRQSVGVTYCKDLERCSQLVLLMLTGSMSLRSRNLMSVSDSMSNSSKCTKAKVFCASRDVRGGSCDSHPPRKRPRPEIESMRIPQSGTGFVRGSPPCLFAVVDMSRRSCCFQCPKEAKMPCGGMCIVSSAAFRATTSSSLAPLRTRDKSLKH